MDPKSIGAKNKGKHMRVLFLTMAMLCLATVAEAKSYEGKASYYWQPQAVACGGRFNPNALTAAHKTLPCGTKVRVTNRRNGKSVVVTINDRGPFVRGRIIDLSKRAAQHIQMTGAGVVPVTVTRI
jgi:rare lipoprotein A